MQSLCQKAHFSSSVVPISSTKQNESVLFCRTKDDRANSLFLGLLLTIFYLLDFSQHTQPSHCLMSSLLLLLFILNFPEILVGPNIQIINFSVLYNPMANIYIWNQDSAIIQTRYVRKLLHWLLVINWLNFLLLWIYRNVDNLAPSRCWWFTWWAAKNYFTQAIQEVTTTSGLELD